MHLPSAHTFPLSLHTTALCKTRQGERNSCQTLVISVRLLQRGAPPYALYDAAYQRISFRSSLKGKLRASPVLRCKLEPSLDSSELLGFRASELHTS